MIYGNRQSGFTAIELLITLFVAAAFLIAGYQLFNVVIKDGGQARAESRAGNVAYDYLRRYTANAVSPCVDQPLLTNSPINVDGLADAKITVRISCPDTTIPSLSKIQVTLEYNTGPQKVVYATYVTGTGSQVADVTEGLIAWWKFNGDANSSVGTSNATTNTATLTTGQGGLPNTAYSFNNSNIIFPMTNFPTTITSITISFWAKQSSVNASSVVQTWPYDSNSLINIHLPWSDNIIYWDVGASVIGSGRLTTNYSNPAWLNTWNFWTFVSGPGEGEKIYRNGALLASIPTYSSFTRGTKTFNLGSHATPTYWAGDIDDMRVYGRTLTAAEVSTLYSGGAK